MDKNKYFGEGEKIKLLCTKLLGWLGKNDNYNDAVGAAKYADDPTDRR